MRLFDPSARPGDNPIARPSSGSPSTLPATVTLAVTILDGGGGAAAGQLVSFGACAIVRPDLRGAYLSEVAISYPEVTTDPNNPPPAPVTLLFSSPPLFLSDQVWRRTYTDANGVATVTLPTPAALAYAAGARTDADMDPARGGRYSVLYYLMLPGADIRTFTIEGGQITNATLDVSSFLMTQIT